MLTRSVAWFNGALFKTSLNTGICSACQGFADQTNWLCMSCEQQLPWCRYACRRCAYPSTRHLSKCGHCFDQWPANVRVQALCAYKGPIKNAIVAYKYANQIGWGTYLGGLMAKKLGFQTYPQAVIWVPSTKPVKGRGYQPTLELAKPIAKALDVPLIQPFAVQRSQVKQRQQSYVKRLRSSSSRFRLNKNVGVERVLIVDDVLTTGLTLLTLSHLLFRQGVKDIQAQVVARAILES